MSATTCLFPSPKRPSSKTPLAPKPQPLMSPCPTTCLRATPSAEGKITALINTACVDRYNTVIVPSGGRWADFMRSGPAVLWEHGKDSVRGRLPVAKVVSISRAKSGLQAELEFARDPFSREIFDNYANGTLRAFSVEFIPDESQSGRPSSDEVRSNPSWGKAHTIYRAWDLSGLSAVAYPGNCDAVALAVRSRGLKGQGRPELQSAEALAAWTVDALTTYAPDFVDRFLRAKHALALMNAGMTASQIDAAALRDLQRRADLAQASAERRAGEADGAQTMELFHHMKWR